MDVLPSNEDALYPLQWPLFETHPASNCQIWVWLDPQSIGDACAECFNLFCWERMRLSAKTD